MNQEQSILLYGTDEKLPEQHIVRAGRLSATFENGNLRWILFDGIEIVRAISFLIRDRNWNTPASVLSSLHIDQAEGHFVITFDAVCSSIDGEFAWHGDFRGWSDGRLECRAHGQSAAPFLTCRTGFVVLHPLKGVAGEHVTIGHVDGSLEVGRLPLEISPEQNYFLIRSIGTKPAPGLSATLTMSGDSWEMEDHRNWSDASFKSYCRPLSRPWPYTLAAGEVVRQTASLVVESTLPGISAAAPPAIEITVTEGALATPSVGLSILSAADVAKPEVTAQLHPGHLNIRLDGREDWRETLVAARSMLMATGADPVIEVVVPQDAVVDALLAAIAAEAQHPSAVIVTPEADLASYPPGKEPPPGLPTWQELASAARRAFPGVRLGGGMLSNFAELNRKRPPVGLFDFVTHATSHIVHAADDQSVMETLESVGHMIASTRAFMGDTAYRIGPSHIGNAFNPYGGVSDNPYNRRVTVARMDPRQRGLFAAAWAVGYLSQAFSNGLEAVTIGAPVGPFGVAAASAGWSQPWFDDQPDAQVYPIFHALRLAAQAKGRPALQLQVGDPGRVRAFGYVADGLRTVVIANLTRSTQGVHLHGIDNPTALVLDAAGFAAAATNPTFMDGPGEPFPRTLELPPFAIARIVAND